VKLILPSQLNCSLEFTKVSLSQECRSSSNTGSLADRVFRPWLSFPINNEDFLNGVKTNCEKFYYDQSVLLPELDEDLPYHYFLKAVSRQYNETAV